MRHLLFVAAAAALGTVLLLVGQHPTHSTPSTPRPAADPGHAQPTRPSAPVDARPEVRRFLTAFLSYEVGVTGPQIESAIRTAASPAFAHQLLSRPPSLPGRPGWSAARITSLHIDPAPGHPDLALGSGEARRRGGPEPFSFLFERRAGRWLAVAPGE